MIVATSTRCPYIILLNAVMYLFLLFFVVGDSACFNQELSSNLLFRRPGDLLPTGILSHEILTNLSASIFVAGSSLNVLLNLNTGFL